MDARFSNETLTFLRLNVQGDTVRMSDVDVSTMRQNMEDMHEKYNESLRETFKGTIQNDIIQLCSTEIPITIYTPINALKDKLIIYFHGGGWVIGSRKTHQVIVNSISDATNITCISVEYRLGPEHKFPVWFNDAVNVTQYIIENKTKYNVDSTAKLGVAGDSSGGTISASVSRILQGIDFQILIYAALDIIGETPSYKEFADRQYYLTIEVVNWFSKHAFHTENDLKDTRVSALLNTTFEDLPPCLVIVADLDVLRDGNIEYYKLLEKAGVQTELVIIKGVVHGFFSLPGIFPKACGEAVNAIRDFVASI